ncbi:LysE family translocator [Reinekea marinisedimentorum]|uniref:Threonine/homoserine/homoserine lactone efflux protein n=1 Tax=Reinekea marinisedimentorum TaxID=230495 RepID=A0A4R3I1K2_9GAMM|nr:LysE family translocator [Reinekea marinisedimentorum]TCS38893.1 threonine/homoserine/homoserine lactone efflux protein [Reinekea marinisedimentorum]
MEILLFLLITSTASLLPGPAVFTAIKNAVQFGYWRALKGILGNCTALLTLYCISAVGLGAIILSSVLIFTVMKVLGGLYLVYLGIKALMNKGGKMRMSGDVLREEVSSFEVFRESYFVGMSNPKAIAFATALLPQFVDTAQPVVVQFVVLSLVSAGASFVVLALYAALAARVADKISSEKVQKWFHRVTGGIFVAFGTALALGR